MTLRARCIALALAMALPRLAVAGATLRIDDDRSITVAVALRSAFASTEKAAPDGSSRSWDPNVEGAILAVSGELTKQVKLQVNSGRAPTGEVRLIDGILLLEPHEHARVWAGRLLPPSDRATFTGPFFGTSWDPPFVAAYPAGFAGRDDGAVVWGTVANGRFKYHAGAFRGRDGGTNTRDDLLWAGRVAINLWEPEPGYYTSGTYHGARNALAIGGGGRFQRHGAGTAPVPPAVGETGDFLGWNADVFMERKIGASAITLEGSYYRFDLEDAADPALVEGEGFYVTGAYLLPWTVFGSAKLQPSARFQALDPIAGPRRSRWDGTLNLLLNGHFAKVGVAVSGENKGAGEIKTVKLGAQIIL